MRTVGLAALFTAAFTCAGFAGTGPETGATRFRVLFQPGVSALQQQGPGAAGNEAALGRIAKAFERAAGLRNVRFVFAAARPDCAGSQTCDANRLTWERLQQLMLAAGNLTRKAGSAMPYRTLAFAFFDELGPGAAPLAAAAGPDALTLFLDRNGPLPSAGACKARVLLRDPDLPPAIEGGIVPVSVADGERIAAGPEAQLAILTDTGQAVNAVWGDGKGRMRKDGRPADGAFRPLPETAAQLYLLQAVSGNKELAGFLDSLGETFAAIPRPPFLPQPPVLPEGGQAAGGAINTASLGGSERAIGDNPHPVAELTVRPRPKREASAQDGTAAITVCQYAFAAGPVQGADATVNPSQ